MSWMTDDEAATEVGTWRSEPYTKELKPALVTRRALWALYQKENENWAASVAKVGIKAASSVLTGSGTLSAIEWLADTLKEKATEELVEKVLESGFDYIAGAHVAKSSDKYKIQANNHFATKVASGFLTILVSAVGGTLTVVSGGTTVAIGAIALLVWIGEKNEAVKRDRWHDIIESAMAKYNTIREKRLSEIKQKHLTQLEQLVKSNAYHDLEDAKLVRSYEWKKGNSTVRARYPNKLLKKLWLLLKDMIDGTVAKQVWVMDVLEVARVYSEETRELWQAIEAKKNPRPNLFNKDEIRDFLEFQVDSHIEADRLPETKTQKALEVLRGSMANEYGEVTQMEDKEGDFKEDDMDEYKATINSPKVSNPNPAPQGGEGGAVHTPASVSSVRRPTCSVQENLSRQAEPRIDVLAAGVFDRPSGSCYFGSSSNHAIFWSLNEIVTKVGTSSGLLLHPERLRNSQANTDYGPLPDPPSSSVPGYGTDRVGTDLLPERQTAVRWIIQFSDTVGSLLPYISEASLISGLDEVLNRAGNTRRSIRPMLALLNIVFAFALSVTQEHSPETYYRQTLGLLDPEALCVSSSRLLQTLLLLALYQQNSQRSTESLTIHCLSVKVAYQLGLHAPISYSHNVPEEKELKSRLWFAVVNQDRIVSSALGQPCLIPSSHVRMELVELLSSKGYVDDIDSSYRNSMVDHFRDLTTLHQIMGRALEEVHDSNMSPVTPLSLHELLEKTTKLSLEMGRWQQNALPSRILETIADRDAWSPANFKASRPTILLAIYYYRTQLMTCGPLLVAVLRSITRKSPDCDSELLRDNIAAILKTDFQHVLELHRLISDILQRQEPFFRENAIWWTCNYCALTTTLHVFGFWLASGCQGAEFITKQVSSVNSMDELLNECLGTLKAIGVASAMSINAYRRIFRYVQLLRGMWPGDKAAELEPSDTIPVGAREIPSGQTLPTVGNGSTSGPSLILDDSIDFFTQVNENDLIYGNWLGPNFGPNEFDVLGFI
ncbi:Putative transcriptional regulatory protein C3C7.04 [Fusarium odoratissimum]|uniref:Putative transcriptional regulatory protein C3C7.04 n=1 Tax=Fusarium oxysporum f. sp. cubense (strain race 4) TaxID=2502994 RepID=N1RBT3_FUSC4|nr:Putative transcriptional regulatory protein C3C7.04 [Fusarium odoratissimum]